MMKTGNLKNICCVYLRDSQRIDIFTHVSTYCFGAYMSKNLFVVFLDFYFFLLLLLILIYHND